MVGLEGYSLAQSVHKAVRAPSDHPTEQSVLPVPHSDIVVSESVQAGYCALVGSYHIESSSGEVGQVGLHPVRFHAEDIYFL